NAPWLPGRYTGAGAAEFGRPWLRPLRRPGERSVGRLPCRSDEHREKRSEVVHNLEHLFLVGEFPERARLLSGLTLEQVTLCPEGASHSIYEELWHVVGYQQSILVPGEPAGDFYPSTAPEHEHQWHDLVRVFLEGARAAAALGHTPDRLALEVEPGVTLADELNSVAVHNAYHLGKIVALRQRIGAWPPPEASADS
ncbi:MAG TPA: hypothetical protein VHQ95_22310, partial [Pyrinomonadaceae bacterium]|nr:hypothetical protein [Pyrinomonadaceae bacterium]